VAVLVLSATGAVVLLARTLVEPALRLWNGG
jgi:hypothetical protein